MTPSSVLLAGGIHAVPMSSLHLYRTIEDTRITFQPGFGPALAGLQPGFSIKGFIQILPPKWSRTLLGFSRERGTPPRRCSASLRFAGRWRGIQSPETYHAAQRQPRTEGRTPAVGNK